MRPGRRRPRPPLKSAAISRDNREHVVAYDLSQKEDSRRANRTFHVQATEMSDSETATLSRGRNARKVPTAVPASYGLSKNPYTPQSSPAHASAADCPSM